MPASPFRLVRMVHARSVAWREPLRNSEIGEARHAWTARGGGDAAAVRIEAADGFVGGRRPEERFACLIVEHGARERGEYANFGLVCLRRKQEQKDDVRGLSVGRVEIDSVARQT